MKRLEAHFPKHFLERRIKCMSVVLDGHLNLHWPLIYLETK